MKATILIFFLSTILSGCSWFESIKTKEKFYCKINGEKFRPDKDKSPVGGIGSDPLRVAFDKTRGVLTIYCRNNPRFVGLTLFFQNETISKGTINLTNDITSSLGIYTQNRIIANPEYLYSNTGKVIITKIDGYNISGTFEFTCKSLKTGTEYKITEGEFNNISYY